MSRDELKPCPLCGGEAKRIGDNRIACKKCGLRTVSSQSFIANQRLWNTRTILDRALAEPEPDALIFEAYASGYARGHDDTVESRCIGATEAAEEYLSAWRAKK